MIDKIIIMSNIKTLSQKEDLDTMVMKTNGFKIESIMYITNTEFDENENPRDMVDTDLSEDMYDDDLEFIVEVADSAKSVLQKVCEYICGYCASIGTTDLIKHATKDSMIYFYNPHYAIFSFLTNEIRNSDHRIFIGKYSSIFSDEGMSSSDEIYEKLDKVYEDLGLNTEKLNNESMLSIMYFASAAIELIYG